MTDDLARLKALAEQATKGPWQVFDGDVQTVDVAADSNWPTHVVCFGHDYDDYGGADDNDKAYIAACSPDVILSLIARLEQVERYARDRRERLIAEMHELARREPYGIEIARREVATFELAEVLRLLREEAK